MTEAAESPLRVAVVGAGVVGLTLAAGLLSHGVDATLYEQASALREIGTGIGLLPTAVSALEALSPAVAAGVQRVCFRSPYFLGLVDGATDEDLSLRTEGSLYDLVIPDEQGRSLYTTARATLVTELLRHVPAERLKLGKKVVGIAEKSTGEQVKLVFADGTTAEADAVVGCDGVKSRVRRAMFGDDHPAASCQYAHEICYRTLVDGPSLRRIFGPLADRTALYLGPRAYLIAYPVGSRANLSLYVDDPNPPPSPDQSHGRMAPRSEAVAALARLGPNIRTLADILPEELGAWALHDLHEHPLPSYVVGRVCVAGDAAHAATSHHGAGAAVGVEDAAVLCKLLARVGAAAAPERKAEMVRAALGLYDGARRERSQWLVWSSRRQGQLMKCMVPGIGADMAEIGEDLRGRSRTLLTWDVDAVLEETVRELDDRIAAMGVRCEGGV